MYILRSYKNLSFKKKALPKKHVFFGKKKSELIATETTEHTEGKNSVLSVYSGAKNTLYIP